MQKKSQGLSISVIILAALGLMVLVVMVLIFTGQMGLFSKNITCTARGGKCLSDLSESKCSDSEEYPVQIYTQDCKKVGSPGAGEKPGQCCIPVE